MPQAYWVNTFRSVSDPGKLAAYIELASGVMERFGGVFLARGMPVQVFEVAPMERTTIIVFPSPAHAVRAYQSAEYQAALEVLGDGAIRDIRIIEATS